MPDKLLISNEADRLTVVAILAKNGYAVKIGKEQTTKGRVGYFVYLLESPANASKSKGTIYSATAPVEKGKV